MSALQGSQLTKLERVWRERDRGAAAASAAVAAHGAAVVAAPDGASSGPQLPHDATGRPDGRLDTIPEEAVGRPELHSAADYTVPAVTGSQHLREPGQHNIKRRKVSRRPLLGGSLLEGF